MRVILDYRERKLIKHFINFCDVLEITNLPIGDFIFDSGLVVERKSAEDFENSMKTDRLWEQLKVLSECNEIINIPIKRKLLLIHGKFTYPTHSIAGAMCTIIFNYGIPVLKIENYELEEYLRILFQREMTGKNSTVPDSLVKARKIPSRDLSEDEWKIYVLSSIPEVGEVLAKRLLQKFGSIQAIANASIHQLMSVEGIGEKKAKIIFRILH